MSETGKNPSHYLAGENQPALLTRDSGVLLRVQILLRWLAISGQLAAVLMVAGFLKFQFPVIESLAVISISIVLNIWLSLRFPNTHRLSVRATALALAYDLIQLVFLLYLTGGLSNPFALLILAPVTVSASTLTAGTTWILVGMAAASSTFLAVYHYPLPWGDDSLPAQPPLYIFGIWMSLLLGLAFISTYVWRVSHEGRRMRAASDALQQVLAREHRLSALDGFAAAAAHQLGTPLGTIGLIAKELQTSPMADGEWAEDLKTLQNEALRCREILTSLTADSDQSDQIFAQMKITALIDQTIEEAGQPMIEIEKEFSFIDEEPMVHRQAEIIYGLGNLIENAGDFARQKVVIRVTQDHHTLTIQITDDGPGFAPELLSRLGEPWLTTRASRGSVTAQSGMGLGFFIAKTMLERTGASLEVSNLIAPQSGASIKLVWPRDLLEISSEAPNL
ncbi:MAG: ActS/PrrB/RegB family redox-sensitive histidine kinase [Parvibaculales bacterium]